MELWNREYSKAYIAIVQNISIYFIASFFQFQGPHKL